MALAFAGNPGAVFLDEPTTGLDVEARHGLWAVIRGYVRDGGTVLLTTHNMDEAEALASRVVVIDHGQILTEGSVEAIRARVQLTRVRFQAEGLPQLPGIVQIEQENRLYTLYTTDADALVRDLVRQGVAFAGIRSTRTLSSIVASCTSRQPTRPSPSMWLPAASVGGTTGTQRHRRTGLSSAGLRSRIARLSEVHLMAICWPSTPRLARCYGSKRRRTTINASSGTVQWRNQSSRPMVATVTATSTDLVFTGGAQWRLRPRAPPRNGPQIPDLARDYGHGSSCLRARSPVQPSPLSASVLHGSFRTNKLTMPRAKFATHPNPNSPGNRSSR